MPPADGEGSNGKVIELLLFCSVVVWGGAVGGKSRFEMGYN